MPKPGFKVITIPEKLYLCLKYEAEKRHLTPAKFIDQILSETLKTEGEANAS